MLKWNGSYFETPYPMRIQFWRGIREENRGAGGKQPTKFWMDDRGYVVSDKWLTTSSKSTSDYREAYNIPVKRMRNGFYALDCPYCGGNDETPPEHTQDCTRPDA